MNDYEDKEKLKELLKEKKSGDDLQRSHYGLPPSNIQYNEVTLSPEEVELYKGYLTNPPNPNEQITMDYRTYRKMINGLDSYGGKKINLKTVIKRINRICTKRKSYWGKKDVYIKYQIQEKIM